MPHFLKKYSTIPNAFIDDFFSVVNERTTQTDFAINLDHVAAWLGMRKGNVHNTLRFAYKPGIDYIARPTPTTPGRHGGHLKKDIMLTPDCFKRLCMRSRSKKAEDVRTYFIALESLVIKYREHMVAGMQQEIERMDASRRGRQSVDKAGYIYVLRASESKDGAYKIGRTKGPEAPPEGVPDRPRRRH